MVGGMAGCMTGGVVVEVEGEGWGEVEERLAESGGGNTVPGRRAITCCNVLWGTGVSRSWVAQRTPSSYASGHPVNAGNWARRVLTLASRVWV